MPILPGSNPSIPDTTYGLTIWTRYRSDWVSFSPVSVITPSAPSVEIIKRKIVQAEYFWNINDPGVGNGIPLIAEDGDLNQAFENLIKSGLSVPNNGRALFNVRVYGLLLDPQNRLLVSDEYIKGEFFTKLPGGGLEFGEGTRDGLAREFVEETGITVTVGAHLYTTDFFQISAFNKKDQIISIYYIVHSTDTAKIKTSEKNFDFSPSQIADTKGTFESFRWVDFEDLNEESMSLPIDKVAIQILKQSI
jgi:ADP-ribose pyrophosphatase YjhB (NUDIX family)